MPPWQGGGDMIRSVTFEKTTYNAPPYKFEAGTPDIAGAVGLGRRLDYLGALGLAAVAAHEHDLLAYATDALREMPGPAAHRHGAGEGRRALLRARRHASARRRHRARPRGRRHPHRPPLRQPVMRRFGVPATARASFALYNRRDDVDALVAGLRRVRQILG